jgi:dipeptidyl aminopeptidase/acylaminoacyl peptidase
MSRRLLISLITILVLGSVACKKEVSVAQPTSSPAMQNPPETSPLISALGKTLWWVDREGREEAIPLPPADYYFPNLSPDGASVAMTVAVGGVRDIYIFDLTKGMPHRLTSDGGHHNQPLWSPDGRQIAYAYGNVLEMNNRGPSRVLVQSVDGQDEARLIGLGLGEWVFPLSWSRNGKIILTSESGPNFGNMDIGMISMEGSPQYTLLLKGVYHEIQPQLSPDGRYLAYASNESGAMEIYVRPFPDVNAGKWQVSTGGGNSPRWSPDGKELYYLVGSTVAEAVFAVPVESEPAFKAGKPEGLFRGNYLGSQPANGIPYAVRPDGQRFLMLKNPNPPVMNQYSMGRNMP